MMELMELVDKDLKTGTVHKFKDLKANMKMGVGDGRLKKNSRKTQYLK